MNTTLDPAKAEDLPALVALLDSLFRLEQDFSPDPTRQRRGLEMLLAREDACLLVARTQGGTVLGMASAQLVVSTAEGGYSAWIEDVVVAEGARGQGIGKALLDGILAWAGKRGARRAQLLADRDNTPALEFYRRTDWQETALIAWRKGVT